MPKGSRFNPRWQGARIPRRHWHFHRQLLERYGIVLEPGEFNEIVREVKSGHAKLIEHRGAGKVIYSVRINRVYERVYILCRGLQIITAWPPEKRLNDIRRAKFGGDEEPQ